MIYIYCTRKSNGATALVKAVNGRRWSKLKPQSPTSDDLVVNWGCAKAPPSLNQFVLHDKFTELQKLAAVGIPVPAHQRKPPQEDGWLARLAHHQEANDLLANLVMGDYYVQFVPCVEEYRVHVFGPKILRIGRKVPRTTKPHPLFKSWNAGWKLSYQGYSGKLPIRDLAQCSIHALGYTFGAVDIGETKHGHPIVFEVNSAPGLEGNTIRVYADAIKECAKGGLP